MADYFIGVTMAGKLALLQGLQQSLMTGQVVRVQTDKGVATEFSPNINNELMYQRLTESIANDPAFDATDPTQAACAANQRPGITRMNFNVNHHGF